jgi:hypothetical protein
MKVFENMALRRIIRQKSDEVAQCETSKCLLFAKYN